MRAATISAIAVAALLPLLGCRGPTPAPPSPPSAAAPADAAASESRIAYPPARTEAVVDEYHGVQVPDPYRWLEDAESPETRAWVEAENRLTFSWLGQVAGRPRLRERLRELWDHERFGIPFRRGGRYFFTRNDGLQNQSVVYTLDSLDGEPRRLLDPNLLSADGTVAVAQLSASDDGRLLAYAVSSAGSDWQEWRVRDVETGTDLEDRLLWSKFSGASWTRDGKGFFYGRFDEPAEGKALTGANYFHKLYYHRIGTPQSDDELVYHRPDRKEWEFSGEVTEDGRYLVITIHQGTDPRTRIYWKDLEDPDARVVELLDDFDAEYEFLGNEGPTFWLETDHEAPRGRVIAVDALSARGAVRVEVIPQAPDTLQKARIVGDRVIALYLEDARSRAKVYRLDGTHDHDVPFAGIGTAAGFGGRRTDLETFFSFATFTSPPVIYRHDLDRGETEVFRAPRVEVRGDYDTRQVFYRSKDGTRVPMFITARKGVELDGRNPTLLHGYGGFRIPMTPSFSPVTILWLELGGVYAVPNLRGGGEYGEEWHLAGTKSRKQNVFDDFVAAAEWLIANGWTSTERLAISGGSNGGLLVGACMTQRPDLFGAALPAVGVLDMLRYHKFTIGWAWTSDFGSSDDAEEFRALLAYSPLHNVRNGTRYPATFITTADHDDRVVPLHSFKFAAALQAAQAGDAPILIRVETRAGHGAGKPTGKAIDEAADRLAFLVRALGVPVP